jgi:dihydroxyacetone kinase-like protein
MQLTVKNFVRVFDEWASIMTANKDYLIQLDSIAGDGDLGLSMTDGFNAMQKFAHETDLEDLGLFFYNSGKAMNTYAPSSLGTLISSGLIEAGKAFKGRSEMTGCDLALFLESIQNGIMNLGKAKIGEKTFLDGFNPAVRVMKENASENNIELALRNATVAAQQGSASTVGMLARWGRAARRGEDSRQILDPGSVVASLMIAALSECLNT